MTRVVTITEYKTPDAKKFEGRTTEGFSATLVYSNDEARISYSDSDGEWNEYNIHPEDAFMEFLSLFYGSEYF